MRAVAILAGASLMVGSALCARPVASLGLHRGKVERGTAESSWRGSGCVAAAEAIAAGSALTADVVRSVPCRSKAVAATARDARSATIRPARAGGEPPLPRQSTNAADKDTAVPTDRAMSAIRFDRVAGLPVAAQPIAAGTYLGRLPALPANAVARGEPIDIVLHAGAVTIARRVETMQASGGRRVFVRDADGQVFSVLRPEPARGAGTAASGVGS